MEAQFKDYKSIFSLPDHGEAYIVADLHGNMANFKSLLLHIDLENNPDRCLISTGDLIHPGSWWNDLDIDETFYLLEEFMSIEGSFPGRVVSLLGNHDHAQMIEESVYKGMVNQTHVFHQQLRENDPLRYKARLKEYKAWWRTRPLVVRSPNGLAVCHAGPPDENIGPRDLAEFQLGNAEHAKSLYIQNAPMASLLWARYDRLEAGQGDYLTKRFLSMLDCSLLVTGHTPPKNRANIDRLGEGLIILDSQMFDSGFLKIPLDRPAPTAAECIKNCFVRFKDILPF